jgi:hypothetical protein
MSSGRTDAAAYPVVWATTGANSQMYSCTAVNIQSSTGTLNATKLTATPNTSGVGTGVSAINGDLTAYRSGGTTGVVYLSSSGSHYLYWDGTNYSLGSNIALHAGNYGGYSVFSGVVSSASGGFQTATYAVNTRNRIWSFGNADGYGLSYFQGTSGYGGVDSIGMHFGTATSAASQFTFGTSGTFIATGNVTAYSDERLKKDWTPLVSDFVEKLAAVKAGTYTRIDSGERQAGSSAQDWQELLPEVVTEGADEAKTLALAYGNAALVSAVELAKRVVDQEARIAKLEALVAQLTKNIAL